MTHGEDLLYLFENKKNAEAFTEEENKTSKLMLTLWTDFAQESAINSWPEYSQTEDSFLTIGPNPETRENIFPERMLFWEKLVWEPLAKTIQSQTMSERKQPTVMIQSTMQFPWPTLIQPVWSRPHNHWVQRIHPHRIIRH